MRCPLLSSRSCLPALLFLGCLTGCQSYYKTFRDVPVARLRFQQVWDACVATADTEFSVDPAQTDRGLREITTRWRTRILPFGQGRRVRAHFEVRSDADDRHLVRYYVERQRVPNIKVSMRPRESDWEAAGQDPEIELRLLHHLRLRLAQAARGSLPSVRGVKLQDPMRRR